MMGWVKLDDDFADHPKVVKAGPEAAWLYVCGLMYCSRYLTDGEIPVGQVSRLTTKSNRRLVERLVDAGLWEPCEGGFRVHDYLVWQTSSAQVQAERDRTRERVKRLRNGGGNAVTSPGVTAVTRRSNSGVLPVKKLEVEEDLTPLPPSTDSAEGPVDGLATNPRATGTNPRALGTNPRSGQVSSPSALASLVGLARNPMSMRDRMSDDQRAAVDACPYCDDLGVLIRDNVAYRCSHRVAENGELAEIVPLGI